MAFFKTSSCRFLLSVMAGIALLSPLQAGADEQPASAVAIEQQLKTLRVTGSVLYVAAHPDDENTQLITYLARGRGYRTAYLSLTRGDGGQNVIGPEFGSALGIIRTQELLAARRLDGARQYFTRALDFGFSKDYRETLRIWDHQQVLSDIVRVIRTFRPDVIVTRFSTEPGGTHGHHTASAVLAAEAFKLAGDPQAFPEQLKELKPWQPRRILQNSRNAGGLSLDISGTDPVLGETFAKIAARSRAMHISQGFANFAGSSESRPENFQLLAGEPVTTDILEGVDTTWSRYPGGAEIGRMLDEAVQKFAAANPAATVPALLQIRPLLATLPADVVVEEKRRDLDRIIQACLGLTVETTVSQAEVVQGENLQMRHTAMVSSTIVPVRWVAVNYPATRASLAAKIDLKSGQAASLSGRQSLARILPSQPYWLRKDPTPGMVQVSDPNLIGLPENPPAFPVEYVFEIGGQTITLRGEPVQAATTDKDAVRRLEVIPAVSLRPEEEVRLFAPGASRPVTVEVTAARPNTPGSLFLYAPKGWKVEPSEHRFQFAKAGESAKFSFTVTAPAQASSANLIANAMVGGRQIDTERVEINYPHIPPLLLQPQARLKGVVLDLAIRGRRVGYLPGAGDSVAEALTEMCYEVAQLSGPDLTPEKLQNFDAIVIGVRAFNVRTDLAAGLPALWTYVENGGNVIAQYNRPNDLKTDKLAPLDLTISGQRVTDENASITILAPDHPALNVPNKITAADFEGWVQERGIYYPNKWDERFTPLLAANDPGEEPLKGGILVAKHGKGYFVYTSLVWFRQLPAGVPGAYRLFANLVSLGK